MRIISFVLASLLAGSAYAQEDTAVKKLGEVIVTGQYKPQSLKSSVYQVRVISHEQILRQAPANVQDVLNKQLNIQWSQDPATGGAGITMMGLSGQNVKILLDGVPFIGRQGTGNEININQLDVNTIERIEIVEGPMSVVYGADALAGVINIITKKTGRDKFSVTARVQEETVGKEYGFNRGIHNQYLGATYNYKNWYFSGAIGRNLFQGWKDTAIGRELLWHKKDQITGNGVIGYRKGRLNAYYRFDGLDEIITNPANIVNNNPAVDQDYMTDRAMHQVQGTYTFNSRLVANALASYTHFTRQVYSTLYYPNGDVRVATAPGLHSLNTNDGGIFRGSVVYSPSQFVSFQPGVDINIESGEGDRVKNGKQSIEDYAFFITSEIKPWPWLNLRPGLRFIHNSDYDAPPVVPSFNTKIVLSKALDLRMAYARGFRAPSIRELYFDFNDANHNILGNTDLKAENSNSYTGSLTWQKKTDKDYSLTATMSGFYNEVKDNITIALDVNNPSVFRYINAYKFKTLGGTIGAELHIKDLNAAIGYSHTGRYNQLREEDKSLPSFKYASEINATVGYSFSKIGLNANLFYKFTGKLPQYITDSNNKIVLSETEGYHTADLTLNKKLFKVLTLNMGIRNLFDVTNIQSSVASGGAHSAGSYSSIGYGRSYFAGLTFNLSK
jgi:outer membrane receptor for ferrienterochelin and colicins